MRAILLAWAWLTLCSWSVEAGPNFCACDLTNNAWLHHMSDVFEHIKDLPARLQDSGSPTTKWVLAQSCAEDASVFPNSDLPVDLAGLLQQGAVTHGDRHVAPKDVCLPGQVAMATVCVQRWIVGGSVVGVESWVQKMAEMLSLVSDCMDEKSILPLSLVDFQNYLSVFQRAVPLPEDPRFVQELAFPAIAKQKLTRSLSAPAEAQCMPLKGRECFPSGTGNALESCMHCCNPAHGPTGDPRCWDATFSFERCCQGKPAVSQAAVGQASEKLDALRGELAQCRKESDALTKAHALEMQKQVETVSASEKAQKAQDNEKSKLEGEVATLRDELKASQAEAKKFKETEEARKKEAQTMQDERKASNNAESSLKAEVKSLQEKLEASKGEVKTLKTETQTQQKEAKSLEEARSKLQTEMKTLSEKLEASQKEAKQLQKEGAQASEKGEQKLRSEITALEERLAASEKEVTRLTATGVRPVTAAAKPKAKPAACLDDNDFCRTWAAQGFCQSEQFMVDTCRKTCGFCQ
mmetsp:Transcript_41161/g.94683  ORF Transcript_41161/g.94683 Transcript_41161/m.94683 type:complete len:524 (+) Transcript_41161:61-1632(+)